MTLYLFCGWSHAWVLLPRTGVIMKFPSRGYRLPSFLPACLPALPSFSLSNVAYGGVQGCLSKLCLLFDRRKMVRVFVRREKVWINLKLKNSNVTKFDNVETMLMLVLYRVVGEGKKCCFVRFDRASLFSRKWKVASIVFCIILIAARRYIVGKCLSRRE